MRLTDLCLYSDRDMSRHGVYIVCCTNSRCSEPVASDSEVLRFSPHHCTPLSTCAFPLTAASAQNVSPPLLGGPSLQDSAQTMSFCEAPSSFCAGTLCTRGPPPVHELESHLISRCPALQTPLALEENLTTFSIKIPPRRAAWIIKKRAPATEYTQGRPGILT